MVPTLIVLGLLALGVGIVAFATRRPAVREAVAADRTSGRGASNRIESGRTGSIPAAPTPYDPFAHAPLPSSLHHEQPSLERA